MEIEVLGHLAKPLKSELLTESLYLEMEDLGHLAQILKSAP